MMSLSQVICPFSREFLRGLLLVVTLLGSAHLVRAQTSAEQTIAQWNASNAICRNTNAPALEAIGACQRRDTSSKLLALMNYCYGPTGQSRLAKWSPCDTAKMAQDASLARTTASFQRMGGVFVLLVALNERVQAYFVVDSGAANIQIPQEVADELTHNGTLNEDDFLGERRFVMADGRGFLQRVIPLRSVRVGNRTMENVLAAVGEPHSQALLGQSLLQRLNWWKIDNVKNAIELEFTGSF
jgi:hypothetical protein